MKTQKMTPTQSPKIVELTWKRKKEIIEHYVEMYVEELASYYILMGSSERLFIDKLVLPVVSPEYREKFQFYIEHPLELRDRLSRLERETQAKTE